MSSRALARVSDHSMSPDVSSLLQNAKARATTGYFGGPWAISFLTIFPPFITNLTR